MARSGPKVRFRSVRAYRRTLDTLIAQARRGECSWAEVNSAQAALRGAAEMLMAENLMRLEEVDDREAPEHTIDEDGGLEGYDPSEKAKVFTKRKIVRTEGRNAKGEPIDTIQTTMEGSDDVIAPDEWFIRENRTDFEEED